MVCPTAILSSSLALSLLRISAPPSQSFVLSPYSLDTALAIVNDGAGGTSQKELTNLLLKGCTAADVTKYYSHLALTIPTSNGTGVEFKSANRFYVDDSISLKTTYQTHIQNSYQVKVENVNMRNAVATAKEMNDFVDQATNGKITNVIAPNGLAEEVAVLINAIYLLGKWKTSFNASFTHQRVFKSENGNKMMNFMNGTASVRLTRNTDNSQSIGTVLVMPYMDDKFSFFYLMPKASSSLKKLRNELTGAKLNSLLKGAHSVKVEVVVPKFKLESKLDGVQVLSKLGVKSIFSDGANLSKISSTPLKISTIAHKAMIEMDEQGTVAAAVTVIGIVPLVAILPPPPVIIDHPFIFGIVNNDNILFIGQFNG